VKNAAQSVKQHFVGTEEEQPILDKKPTKLSELDGNGFVKLQSDRPATIELEVPQSE